MNDIGLTFSAENFESLNELLILFTLPPKLKRRYLGRLAQKVRRHSAGNVKLQKTVFGQPFTPRKMQQGTYKLVNKRSGEKKRVRTRKEMLWKLARKKHLTVWYENDNEVIIKYRNGGIARVAAKHQYGGRALGLKRKVPDYPFYLDPGKVHNYQPVRVKGKAGCSVSQAAMLFRLGFVYRGKRPDYQWIRKNITRAQAAVILEKLLQSVPKLSIPDDTPARPFLGARPEQIREMGNEVMDNLYTDLVPKRLRK